MTATLVPARVPLDRSGLCDVEALLAEMEPALRELGGRDIDVVLDLDAEQAAATVEPQRLEQAVIALAAWGRAAMAGDGLWTLRARRVEVGTDQARRLGCAAGPYVLLSASDTGDTVAPATEGLALARTLARQAGGALEVEASARGGHTVWLWLPSL